MRSYYSENHSNLSSTSNGTKARHAQQHIACDRCRGQKLRCIQPTGRGACDRCLKAGTNCVTDPAVRMGRRPRHFNQNNNNAARQAQAQNKRVEIAPSHKPPSSFPGLECSNASSDDWAGSDPSDGTVDRTLTTESGDFAMPGVTFDSNSVQVPAVDDCFDDDIGLMAARVAPHFSNNHLGMNGSEHRHADGSMPSSGTLRNDSLGNSNPLGEIFDSQDLTELFSQPFPPYSQEPFTTISNLNLELRQQIAIVSELVKEFANTEPSLLDQDQDKKTDTILSAIAFMIHGLQTYYDSILDILGLHDAKGPVSAAKSRPDAHFTRSIGKDRRWPYDESNPSVDIPNTGDGFTENCSFEPWKIRLDASSRDTASDFDPQDSTSRVSFLDVSSSLFVLSCYINLVRFCRAVFVCVRGGLALGCQLTCLQAVSGLEFTGISIHHDPDLQLVILIQMVIRLVDKIEIAFGPSHDAATKASTREKYKRGSKAVPPHIVEFVLKQQGVEEHSCCEGGPRRCGKRCAS